MSICKPVKQKFQDWTNVNNSIYQYLIMDPEGLTNLWSILESDPSCHYHNDVHYSIKHAYVCKACRTIDQICVNGKILPNEKFEVECFQDNFEYILNEYPNIPPYLEIKDKRHIITDKVTKQYLINILLSKTVGKYLQKYYIMYHCGNNIYILKDDNLFPIQNDLFATHPDYAIGIFIQLFYLCQRLNGLFHGSPFLSSLRIRDKDWHRYNFMVCIDGFDRSRIYTPDLQISSQGQMPIVGRDRIAIDEREDGKWIYLTKHLLHRTLKDMIEYIPTLDFYGFVLSLISHLNSNSSIDNPEYSILKSWFEQLFRKEQLTAIYDRIRKLPITNIEQLQNTLEGIWIRPDFTNFTFETFGKSKE